MPARDYRLVAELLAGAMQADGTSVLRAAVEAAATRFGRELAIDATGDLTATLADRGYEPYRDGNVLRLRNCPFHAIAREHVDLVCGMNLALMRGVLSVVGDDDLHAVLDPAPDRCCVAFVDTP